MGSKSDWETMRYANAVIKLKFKGWIIKDER
jgi:phosphoribosylcarboxyaminoimidazole (NCAIR) mutase